MHKTVQNIQNDLDDLDEIKQREADNKRRLAENEEGILSPDRPKKKPIKGWGSRKSLDGEIENTSGSSSNNSSAQKAAQFPSPGEWDFTLASILGGTPLRTPGSGAKELEIGPEEFAESAMDRWFEHHKLTFDQVLLDAEINHTESLAILESIEWKPMLAVYCARGEQFSIKNFTGFLTDVRVDRIASVKLFSLFQKIRKDAVAWVKKEEEEKKEA